MNRGTTRRLKRTAGRSGGGRNTETIQYNKYNGPLYHADSITQNMKDFLIYINLRHARFGRFCNGIVNAVGQLKIFFLYSLSHNTSMALSIIRKLTIKGWRYMMMSSFGLIILLKN